MVSGDIVDARLFLHLNVATINEDLLIMPTAVRDAHYPPWVMLTSVELHVSARWAHAADGTKTLTSLASPSDTQPVSIVARSSSRDDIAPMKRVVVFNHPGVDAPNYYRIHRVPKHQHI